MKRVCLVRQKAYPKQRNLRRNAETLVKEGHEVDVVCIGLEGQSKHETINGVNVHRVYYSYHRDNVLWYILDYINFFLLASLTLVRLSVKKRFDVIEVQTMPDFLVFVTVFPKLLGSKIVLYMFENTTQLFISKYRVKRSHIFARIITFIAKISAHYADSVIVSDGPLHKNEVESYGIASDKITVVLNVPDNSVFKLDPDSITKNGTNFHLVVVTSILKRYGVDTLINSLPFLIEKIPEIMIDVVGDGNFLPYLQQLTRDQGFEKYVLFTGYVPYEQVPPYIAQADICVAPALDDVGAPNKIFEYSAFKKPTVASSLPGIRSVFDDSCVQYYQPGNEEELATRVIELYQDDARRAALSTASNKVYTQYHWPVMKQTYLGVYKKLLD